MRRLSPTWWQLVGLATFGAALYSWAAIPTVVGAAIAWAALVPLLAALDKASARQAIGIGGLYGLLSSLSLAAVMLPVPGVSAQHILVPSLYLALYPALWGLVVVLARDRFRNTLAQDGVAVAAWIVLDYLRGNIPLLAFPLGSLGQTQVENLPLIQIAAVFGEPGVTCLVLLGNLALWRWFRREPLLDVALRAAPVLLSAAVGALLLNARTTLATVPIGVLHTHFPSFGDGRVAEAEQDRITLRKLTQLPNEARAVFTPETSFRNLAAKPELMRELQSLADRRDSSLIVGVAQAAKFELADPSIHDRRIRAGVWIFRPHASTPERYDKVLRVPFGEYLPWSDFVSWPKWLAGTPMQVIRGHGPQVYELPSSGSERLRAGAMVCWEGLFAAHARQLTRDGAQVLFQVANEGWFANTSVGVRHNAAVRFRAIENRRWVVVSSNAGPAEIIDTNGRVLSRSASAQDSAWVSANVAPGTGLSIYARLGDLLVCLCALVCVLAAAWTPSRRLFRLMAREAS